LTRATPAPRTCSRKCHGGWTRPCGSWSHTSNRRARGGADEPRGVRGQVHARRDALRRCRSFRLDLDGVGDAGPPTLRERHPDAVTGLDQTQLDPLTPEGDDAVGPDVEADGGAGDLNVHLPA